MRQYFIGACALPKARVPFLEACWKLKVYALGWGGTGDVSKVSPKLLPDVVWRAYPDYKRTPREAAEMLELMKGMNPGDRICFRHRHKDEGNVIIAFGKVTSKYFWDQKGIDDLFSGHDMAHRVSVRWEWFDPDDRPPFPEHVWLSSFGSIQQGRSLVRTTADDWSELEAAARDVERGDLGFDD